MIIRITHTQNEMFSQSLPLSIGLGKVYMPAASFNLFSCLFVYLFIYQ